MNSTPHYSTFIYFTLLYTILHYSTLLYITLLFSTLRNSILLYSTDLYSYFLSYSNALPLHLLLPLDLPLPLPLPVPRPRPLPLHLLYSALHSSALFSSIIIYSTTPSNSTPPLFYMCSTSFNPWTLALFKLYLNIYHYVCLHLYTYTYVSAMNNLTYFTRVL